MPWGSFTTVHLSTLAFAIVFNIVIYLILKRMSRSKQIIALFALSLVSVGIVVGGMIANKDDILRNLPLSFAAISILLLPLAIITRGKKLCNRVLLWSAGSILALVFNSSMENVELMSAEFITYFSMHLFGAGIPILLFELNLVKRNTKTIKSTAVITILIYTAVHVANLVINSTNGWSAAEGVNYMATLYPNTEFLNFLYAIIPAPYWYMVLTLPALVLYVLYWYLPEILDQRRRRKPLRKKLDDIDEYYEEYEEEYIEEIINKRNK